MKIIFTGDVFLGGDLNKCKISEADIKVPEFWKADKRIINLEQAISNSEIIADKGTLYTDSYAVEQLKFLKVSAVNLANNHIHDKGISGITETCENLKSGDIEFFGAGENLSKAKKPYKINENLVILGYCEYGKSYLKQIQVADEKIPGVNPLRYENIIDDLNKLPENKKAILYFHWGREHVSLPPQEDIILAKKLLENKKVLTIIGTHSHRIQGVINYKNKKAYMGTGNFIFPNFYIKPPIQLFYPKIKPKKIIVTRQYHKVKKIVYKKWCKINRISLLIEYDTDSKKIKHIPVIQHDDKTAIYKLKKFEKKFILFKIKILSRLYKLPIGIYKIIEYINKTFVIYRWRIKIICFQIRHNGISWLINRLKEKFEKK